MINIFYRIYVFINRHKTGSFLLLFLILSALALVSSRIKLEENISSVIPQDEELARLNRAFEGFKMNNRLVLHLYYKDSSQADPEQLIAAAHGLSDSLQQNYQEYISEIRLEIADTNIETLYNFYYRHLPFYLQEGDYTTIEERTSQEGTRETLNRNFRALMSPMGIGTKKMLVKDPYSLVSMPLQRARNLQMDDNIQLYQNHLLTKDHRHLIFFVSLANPASETAQNAELIRGLEKLEESFQQLYPSVTVEYFGSSAVAVANAGQIKQDIYLTVGIAIVALFLFISLFYRSAFVFFIAVTPGIFGALVAIAVLVMLRDEVSVIALGVGSVLLGITIDYALHLFTHSKVERDMRVLFEDLSLPLLMSSLTTACAFLSLVFLRSNALADLGIFAGVSVIASALYTLVVLPHFIVNRSVGTVKRRENLVERGVAALAAFPFDKSKWAIAVFALLSAVSLFTWQNYSFESNMLQLNYMPDHLARYEQNLNRVSTYSANNVFLISTGKDLWSALESEAAMKRRLDSLQQEGVIMDYLAVSDIVPPRSVQEQSLRRWNSFWQQRNRDSLLLDFQQSAQQVGFQAAGFKDFEQLLRKDFSLLKEEDASEIFSVVGEDMIIQSGDSVAIITTVKTNAANKKLVLQAFNRAEGTLIFDKAHFTNRLVELLQEDFNLLVNLSLVVVFLIILISYGRIELALITFIPILLSWLWILGLMGLLGLTFNIVNIIICTFIFGLGVDYSIFVMRGLTQQYKFGLANILSYKKSIILSAVTTLLGIGVLAFAQHPALRSIALLAIIGILSVIFLTFTVEPILYNFLIQGRKEKGLPPFTVLTLFLSLFAFLYFLFGCLLLMLIRLIFLFPFASERKRKRLYHQIMMLFCRSLIYIMVNVKKKVIGRELADFSRPSVIISNHHSFLDIILLLMFHPKVVMVTNDWVYHSPFFGKAVQFADFIPTSNGVENQLDKIGKLVEEGYSIIIFPEGTRSDSSSLNRFHKGAFYLAEHYKLDIQPVLLHGTSYTMPRADGFYLKNGTVTVKFLPRIAFDDAAWGNNYSERAKSISRYFKSEYQQLRQQQENPDFFKEVIIKNYIYKGPVLEWYLRVKYGLEKGYELFHSLIPANASVVDLGCGYGFLPYSLAFSGEGRQVTGIDYDTAKIEVAKNCPVKPANVQFDHGDVTTYPYGEADVFVVSDVLHYLLPEDQQLLLNNMVKKLKPGGKIILRDGDSSKKDRHKGTKLTEVFSTGSGFNKTKNELHFISGRMVEDFAAEHGLELEIIDNTKLTSNTVFVLRHKGYHGEV
ncbi:1-acyl-sn-glycerol-3-phosphate acyltransferase [Cesiribacter sp. SM1]|uniref:1-acyl-sn-glycerol-3-phosphate acyltransferase n=1 Tax=Cesiribacter sp. SM1 TaxID=2861196 RepID=UPI001CD3C5AF|nr:1-acyl-sn-glycerol-3-phosphate acyltransferase [Cesiribacter sp. SM1]